MLLRGRPSVGVYRRRGLTSRALPAALALGDAWDRAHELAVEIVDAAAWKVSERPILDVPGEIGRGEPVASRLGRRLARPLAPALGEMLPSALALVPWL